jgi:hypothetical protein
MASRCAGLTPQNRLYRFVLPHRALQPMGDPTHGDACRYDQHQQRYQAVSKPAAAGLWCVHPLIIAESGGRGIKPAI